VSSLTILNIAKSASLYALRLFWGDKSAARPRAKELFDRNKLPSFHDPFSNSILKLQR
jgi:hypothetical protein